MNRGARKITGDEAQVEYYQSMQKLQERVVRARLSLIRAKHAYVRGMALKHGITIPSDEETLMEAGRLLDAFFLCYVLIHQNSSVKSVSLTL